MEKKSGFHWAWIILATCFINLFISYSVRLGYGVVLPEMITNLDLSRTSGGTIYNAYLFCYIAITPFTGYLTDRLGARRVISACALFLGTGVLLMGTAKSLTQAALFYAIVGLGATGMWTPVITVVQRWFDVRRRGLALGILSTGYGLGFATMGAAFPWVVQSFSWRHAWYFLGAGALVMVAVNGLLLRSDPLAAGYRPWGQKKTGPETPAGLPGQQKKVSISKIFKTKTFWLIGASYFCISYSLYGLTTFMVDYAKYQLGWPLEKASYLATIHGLCQIVGVLTILPLSDRLGRRKTVILSNSVIAAALAAVLLSGNSGGLLYWFVGVFAVFYGVTFPLYGACAGDYFPKEVMGTVIGAWTPYYGLGAILVHWVSGLLRDASGSYNQAFIINVVMAGLAVLFMLPVKKTSEAEFRE